MTFKEPTILDTDASASFTCATPPESIVTDLQDLENETFISCSSVPWPGSTFLIRSVQSGKLITLQDGRIKLLSPGSGGSFHWECREHKGWLGFRNTSSGRYLGHNVKGNMVCDGRNHGAWENFCARQTPEGGYILMMTHWERLWHVGVWDERGEDMLAKIADGGIGGMVWEFIKA